MKPQAVRRSARYLAVRRWRRGGGLYRAGAFAGGAVVFGLALLECRALLGLAP